MKVIKVLNNSLVLSTDSDNNEAIVMGKGIGFNSKVGDVLDPATIEKVYVVQNSQKGRDYLRLMENTPEEHLEIVQMILAEANRQLNGRINEQIFFTLADHISFAIERYHKGIAIQNRLLFEVKRFYPQEFAVAMQALGQINQRLNITLPEEEAGNIAFHLVNGQTDVQNMEHTLLSVKMLKDIFNIIKYHFRINIDTDSLNYARFLVHMQFFIQRMVEGQQMASKDDFIFAQVTREYPNAYRGALLIRDYVKNLLEMEMSNDELLYLVIHLTRITDQQD
ncbi:Transcription antiterminator LicT [Serratia plymuthica]|uniref:BglG family transcription antiterminator LicT n=1 Tax=Serratia TaxID=613 RepID=UPI00020E9AD4|nr:MULTISPECIES: PRD domain-containing protein [Serratia]AEF45409.1 transcriptional antiterminator, BglG [Serratia plymuthica AS9]AEF50360.1 transcriptional antiterminator, BglG [Serratia sp. AS12]AEG28067.1 transcriptional antiterminator, BglG [Serratia sp. AS13]MBJ7893958.1 PRD domain-containing protein [Serratia sp. PAMC26656]UTN98877.1 PRD domain-containing protein [Serratia plymuthica]